MIHPSPVLPRAALAAFAFCVTTVAQADVQITEWMYNGVGATGEYVELTNLGTDPVDFAGWSFDDNSRTPGSFSLSGFGLVAAGASVILTEATAAAFSATWNLGAGVKVVGSNTNNLGGNDEINIYDASGMLVDRLTYGVVPFPGTVVAANRSGNPGSLADLVPQNVTTGWTLATVGDAYGSYAATTGDIGNPGVFALAVPEPDSWALLLAGGAAVAAATRRRAA